MTYIEDKSATIIAASHWLVTHVTSVPLVVSAFSRLGTSRENPQTAASIKYNNYFLTCIGCLVSVAGVLAFTAKFLLLNGCLTSFLSRKTHLFYAASCSYRANW